MRMIIISEKDLNDIFARVEKEYEYDHEFMKGHENGSMFKETLRYQHLMRFRNSIKSLKNQIPIA